MLYFVFISFSPMNNLTYDDEPVELKNDISSYRNK